MSALFLRRAVGGGGFGRLWPAAARWNGGWGGHHVLFVPVSRRVVPGRGVPLTREDPCRALWGAWGEQGQGGGGSGGGGRCGREHTRSQRAVAGEATGGGTAGQKAVEGRVAAHEGRGGKRTGLVEKNGGKGYKDQRRAATDIDRG